MYQIVDSNRLLPLKTQNDKDKGIIRLKLIPNPKRYEWTKNEGKNFLYDKFTKFMQTLYFVC